jgi:AcrR family transcriptional regulator
MDAMVKTKVAKRPLRGRRPGVSAGNSRASILVAARTLFAKHGFYRTTTRSVAARAKVDPALVHYFFGTKARLFAAVIELPVPTDELRTLLQAGSAGLGERVARFFLERVFGTRSQAIAAILRAAIADPGSVPALRALIEQRVVSAVAPALRGVSGREARLRAELLGSQFVGLFVMRHILRIEPVASASVDELAPILGRGIDALLSTPSAAERA